MLSFLMANGYLLINKGGYGGFFLMARSARQHMCVAYSIQNPAHIRVGRW